MRHPDFPRRSAATRRFSLGRPRSVSVAPDGSQVLFLRSSGPTDPVNRLFALDLTSGEERLLADPTALLDDGPDTGHEETLEERARRERAREQAGGITSYATDRAHAHAVFVLAGNLFLVEVANGRAVRLETVGPAFDARPGPAGDRVAYVSGGQLHVTDVHGGDRRLLGEDTPGVTWGLAEFVAAEEMGRGRGFWWAPDGDRIAAARVDASAVASWHLADPANPGREPTLLRYPAAGTTNADVGLAVVALDGHRVDVAWDREGFPYLVSVTWESGAPLTLEVHTRDLRTMRVLTVDHTTGATQIVHEQSDDAWVEPVAGTPTWLDGQRLVTVADVVTPDDPAGTRRILVDGRPASPTGLQVTGVVAAADGAVWFTASRDPLEHHVHRLDVGSGQVAAVTEQPGWHGAVVGADVTIVSSATLDDPHVQVRAHRDGRPVTALRSVADPAPLDPRPRYLELGERGLHGALLLPDDGGTSALPVLLSPYGGPHAPPRAARTRHGLLEARWFADQGFAVLVVDGRGTPGRGPVWERAVHRDLATPVLEDQVDALHAAAGLEPRLDLGRVGIRGWSFGGFLAALAVLRRPDVFHAAVAGAPVTDWHLYDTYYTERYLGHPDDEPAAYRVSSLVDGASELIDPAPVGEHPPRLLVIHGLSDDNVVAAHSLRLSAALLAAGRPHQFLPLSGVTHMTPQEVVAERLLHLQLRFLQEVLDVQPAALPTGVASAGWDRPLG